MITRVPKCVVLASLAVALACQQRPASPVMPSATTEANEDAVAITTTARPAPPNGAIVRRGASECGIWGGYIGFNAYMYGAAFTEVTTPSGVQTVSCTNGPIAPGFTPQRTVVVKAELFPFGTCTYRYLQNGRAHVACVSNPNRSSGS